MSVDSENIIDSEKCQLTVKNIIDSENCMNNIFHCQLLSISLTVKIVLARKIAS